MVKWGGGTPSDPRERFSEDDRDRTWYWGYGGDFGPKSGKEDKQFCVNGVPVAEGGRGVGRGSCASGDVPGHPPSLPLTSPRVQASCSRTARCIRRSPKPSTCSSR